VTQRYTYIWAFKVHAQHVAAFREHYGEGGAWVQLFRRAPGYLGTQLLQDRADPLRFVTIDSWRSAADYEAFRASYAAEYDAIDRLCEGFTSEETLIGKFAAQR
jgi:quinol monooxygenase YgiN